MFLSASFIAYVGLFSIRDELFRLFGKLVNYFSFMKISCQMSTTGFQEGR